MNEATQHPEQPPAAAARLPVVAIVGRPNVGKSTLFNRISGTRKAVVLDTPGVTRDRNYIECDVGGRPFMLIDTGGFDFDESDVITAQMREQIQLAVEEADAIIFLVELQQLDHPIDFEIADRLRRTRKPVLVAVNKCDNVNQETEAFGFADLGLGNIYPISAIHGNGVAEMLDDLIAHMPAGPAVAEEEGIQRIAVVGRQNVGKSTLVNQILGAERVIANPTPGTTRDAIDTPFVRDDRRYLLIDTAGIRRRGKVERGIEKLSVMSALFSLQRCDVALIVLNAKEGLTDQDAHIAGYAEDSGRLLIFLVNKWDLIEKDTETAGEFAKKIRQHFKFLAYVPILFLSAKTGQRVKKIFDIIDQLQPQFHKQISTPDLNRAVQEALSRHSPPLRSGRRLKIYYAVQTGVAPPIFTLFVNDPKLVHFSYRRFLVNQLREAFGIMDVPFRLKLRKKTRRENPR